MMVRKMVEEKKISNSQRVQVLASLLVLAIALAIGAYKFYSKEPSSEACSSLPHLTYWPISIYQRNGIDHLRNINRVFDRLGYRKVNGSEETWDVLWSVDFPFESIPDKLKSLKPHQLINHFPGITFLTNKM